jgi:hypothetical protein
LPPDPTPIIHLNSTHLDTISCLQSGYYVVTVPVPLLAPRSPLLTPHS